MNDIMYKTKKIKELKSEVKDFHPLLRNIFDSMPGVTAVEYTHGNTELGADFVLTKFDEIIGDTFYVGVIVKKGKIQIDFSNIERQIEECELPRIILGGKKKVNLTDIWIITNESVSNTAETKIHYKFSNKKIIFIENSRIVKWVDSYLPNYWYDYGIKIGKYLENVHNQILIQDRQFNLLKLSSDPFYIEQDIVKVGFEYTYNKSSPSKPKKVNFFEIVQSEKIALVEAGMGSGKSKLLRELAKNFSSGKNYSKYKFLPVMISYRTLIEKYGNDIAKLLSKEIPEQALREQEKNSKILLLIDSVDEWKASQKEQTEALKETIKNISKIENLHVVLATRHLHGFRNQKDISEITSFYEIYPLTLHKLLQFLYKVCQMTNLSKRIIEDLKKSQLFKELPKTPIAALILANLLNENSKELPSNITELYSKYTELMLGRWDMDKGLQSQKEYEAAIAVSQQLALYFIDNNLSCISIDEANNFFVRYLDQRNIQVNHKELFDKVVNRSGLLVKDTINSTIMFKHKTLAEYLYAMYHERKNSLKIDERAYDVYWDSIFFFYIGIKKDCPKLLQEIVNLKPTNNAQRWNRIINLSNYLLAGFSSPYEIVSNNLYKILLESTTLYFELIEGKIKSPFSLLPEIRILCLFQLVLRESYAYNYFKEAIDAINIYIDDAAISDKEKMYGLFFAGAIAMDLKVRDPFDFLLDKYKNILPIQLKLAISHEAQRLEHMSSNVKKTVKKLNQARRKSKAIEHYVQTLYKKPLRVEKIT